MIIYYQSIDFNLWLSIQNRSSRPIKLKMVLRLLKLEENIRIMIKSYFLWMLKSWILYIMHWVKVNLIELYSIKILKDI